MSRNRKSQSAALRFGPALKAFVLCLLIGGSGVGYVWQRDQINRLGEQMKSREVRLNQLEDQNQKLRKMLASMRGAHFLELRIQELKLGLVPPQLNQVLRLSEPGAETGAIAPETQLAAHDRTVQIP
jgi:hypothetical protein